MAGQISVFAHYSAYDTYERMTSPLVSTELYLEQE